MAPGILDSAKKAVKNYLYDSTNPNGKNEESHNLRQNDRFSSKNIPSGIDINGSAGPAISITGGSFNRSPIVINHFNSDSKVINNQYQSEWNTIQEHVDFDRLADEISNAILQLKNFECITPQIEHDRDIAICILLAAKDEAKKNSGPKILEHLAKLKDLPSMLNSIIASAGGQILGSVILAHFGLVT